MTDYDIYVFILCFIVFSLFTAVFSYAIATITKQKFLLIRHGLDDERIKKEQLRKAKASTFTKICANVFSLLICVALFSAFSFSLYLNFTKDKAPNGIPSLKVVKTSSMATKNKNNAYLFENGLDDQIQTFDLIVTHHLPAENELELYDIVVYQQEDVYVIHRIIGIEEPNDKHPDCRHFLFQGDAVMNPDQFPVLYSQMQGIYKGERVPFIGSFILFMQSPAGLLCVLLVLFVTIITPILEKKLDSEEKARLNEIGFRFEKDAPKRKRVRGGQND